MLLYLITGSSNDYTIYIYDLSITSHTLLSITYYYYYLYLSFLEKYPSSLEDPLSSLKITPVDSISMYLSNNLY